MRVVYRVLWILVAIIVFLAWSGGAGAAGDFAGGAGRVTGDVASAMIGFFEGLADSKPGSELNVTKTSSSSTIVAFNSNNRTSSTLDRIPDWVTTSTAPVQPNPGTPAPTPGTPEIDPTTGKTVGTQPPHTHPSLPPG